MLNCHCRDCQSATGSAYAAIVVVPRATVRIEGELRYHRAIGDSGKAVERGFCPSCGSPVAARLEKLPDILGLQAGSLDDPSLHRPAMDLFTASAQPWITCPARRKSFRGGSANRASAGETGAELGSRAMKEVFSNHGKTLIEMAMSFMHSRVICAAARLELADELGLGPCSAVRLADKCSADPDALHRLLRALAALGIVREDEPGTFTLTDAGEPLQKTAANSVWPAVIFWARPDGRWMVAPDGKRAHGTDRRRDHAA